MAEKKVTMQMVANRLGISKSTVSKAISNYGGISEKTRKKVLDAMKEMDFHPNSMARNLANDVSKNIGLILPNGNDDFFISPFFQNCLRGMTETAGDRGYDLLIIYNGNDVCKAVDMAIKERKVDGIILLRSTLNNPIVKYLKQKNFPFVLIGKSLDFKDINTVDIDNIKASYDLTERLIKKGCKEIAFIGGNKDSVVTIDRKKGYYKALKNNNLSYKENMAIESDFTSGSGYFSMKDIMAKYPDTDGVIVTDEIMFIGVANYISEYEGLNKKVIAGIFGNGLLEIENPLYKSKIDVIKLDINSNDIGSLSCNKIIDIIENKEVQRESYIRYDISK